MDDDQETEATDNNDSGEQRKWRPCRPTSTVRPFKSNSTLRAIRSKIYYNSNSLTLNNPNSNTHQLHVPIVNQSKHELPAYKSITASGMDLHANISIPIIILPQQR